MSLKVMGHQTGRVHLPRGLLASLFQCLKEPLPILLVPENRFPPIAAVPHLVDRSRILHPQLPCPARSLPYSIISVNSAGLADSSVPLTQNLRFSG
jgi:hypothetical protein